MQFKANITYFDTVSAIRVILTDTPFVRLRETKFLAFRSLFFRWCQITSVWLKSCSFSPLPCILTCNSQSLTLGASLFLNFVRIRFWVEKSLLQSTAVQSGLVWWGWEAHHSGLLQEVATIPSSNRLGNAAIWLLSFLEPTFISVEPFSPHGDGTSPCRPKIQQNKENNRTRNSN